MRYLALATDYDGTIAHHGHVSDATLAALKQFKDSGRKLILVTGREFGELKRDFEHLKLFDYVVAENGALLFDPVTEVERALGQAPDPALVERLRDRNIGHLSVGKVIIATHEPYENLVLEAIRDLSLEYQVIFNKGAVMALPSGLNKSTGLKAALNELGLSPHNLVGVGDAENDHTFLDMCGCAAVVANALPALKEKADLVTAQPHGLGVSELIQRILDNDLDDVVRRFRKTGVAIGETVGDGSIDALHFDENLLVAGSSGGGKSTFVTGLLERAIEQGYQAVILDPEGDHVELQGALILGSSKQAPTIDELAGVFEKPGEPVVANITSIPLEDQPAFLQALAPRLRELRERTGRPHFIVLDEVHHVLPRDDDSPPSPKPFDLRGVVAATVEPEHVATSFLRAIDRLVVKGDAPGKTIHNFCDATRTHAPADLPEKLEKGRALHWKTSEPAAREFEITSGKSVRRRHVRKYAEGDLGEERSFVFRGPAQTLKLRAKNLNRFVELAEGVDDDTWRFHLEQHDYSHWIREQIKDPELADAVAAIEESRDRPAGETRASIREEIEKRYTASA
ncbi:MAG: HAD-IIB family hydrolase [Opitutaceae bacterium]